MRQPTKITVHTLRQMKQGGEKIGVLTAYDAAFAHLFDEAGVEVLLVGDSLGMVIQGEKSTLPVTMDQMVYHCRAVSRAVRRAHVVGDMPFMSYQASEEDAVRNAGRLVAEGGAESVKLEGGQEFAATVERIVRAGIPVMGHVGLTPQSVHKMGGFVVQGRDEQTAKRLLADAQALERAGAYALVLEGIPSELAREITVRLSIPTIGIGAGVHADGQVLVCYDMLGMNPDFAPKFLKRFAELFQVIGGATKQYLAEVKAGQFPAEAHSFHSRTLQLIAEDEPEAKERGPLYGGPIQ
ncbi:MAG: 3-methyl-2-oxobutanoate hydroxymethyltransferase [Deltaproteobacteria bacterium]|nr:3-methyl-2-oxobutanoate hydroxymethyltransferase [Deltaproteobacteria bacterium]